MNRKKRFLNTKFCQISMFAFLAILTALIPKNCQAQIPWDKGTFSVQTSVMGVIPTENAREDQFYETLIISYGIKIFNRHEAGVFTRTMIYHDGEKTIKGFGFGIYDRIQAVSNRRVYIKILAGGLLLDERFQNNAADFVFTSAVSFGYEFPESPFFLEIGAQHTSNGYFKSPNTGVNAAGITLGYRF